MNILLIIKLVRIIQLLHRVSKSCLYQTANPHLLLLYLTADVLTQILTLSQLMKVYPGHTGTHQGALLYPSLLVFCSPVIVWFLDQGSWSDAFHSGNAIQEVKCATSAGHSVKTVCVVSPKASLYSPQRTKSSAVWTCRVIRDIISLL